MATPIDFETASLPAFIIARFGRGNLIFFINKDGEALVFGTHRMMFLKISISLPIKLLRSAWVSALMLLFCWTANVSLAQSIDISSPAPIRTNEVEGRIAARDLGDSRLTDHFYAFRGTPGDVLITVKSNNLNGDIDLFTAGSLRPLMKFTLYAENSSPVTRTIFLRKREDLILRVEARSPNDDEGVYHIRLGGSFEPIAGDIPLAEANTASQESAISIDSRGKGSRRVSSVGARIAEPPVVREEVAAAPTPTPIPEDLAAPTPTTPTTPTAEPTPTEAPAPAPARGRARGRVPPGRRKPASQPTRKNEQASAETKNEEKASEAPKADSPASPARRTARRGDIKRTTEPTAVQEPLTGPRLVIELQDGTRIERFMSTIRRVTVENNQIVVVGKDGRVERTRMSEVIRMSIEP